MFSVTHHSLVVSLFLSVSIIRTRTEPIQELHITYQSTSPCHDLYTSKHPSIHPSISLSHTHTHHSSCSRRRVAANPINHENSIDVLLNTEMPTNHPQTAHTSQRSPSSFYTCCEHQRDRGNDHKGLPRSAFDAIAVIAVIAVT